MAALNCVVVEQRETMFQMVMLIIKWVSFPALVICLGTTVFVQRAVRLKQYLSAAGFVAIAVIFSPLLLVVKIFLLIGATCVATCVALLAAFRTQPLPAA